MVHSTHGVAQIGCNLPPIRRDVCCAGRRYICTDQSDVPHTTVDVTRLPQKKATDRSHKTAGSSPKITGHIHDKLLQENRNLFHFTTFEVNKWGIKPATNNFDFLFSRSQGGRQRQKLRVPKSHTKKRKPTKPSCCACSTPRPYSNAKNATQPPPHRVRYC